MLLSIIGSDRMIAGAGFIFIFILFNGHFFEVISLLRAVTYY